MDGTEFLTPTPPSLSRLPLPLGARARASLGVVDVLQFDDTERLAVVRLENGLIEIWDALCWEVVHSLGVRLDRVARNIFTNSKHVVAFSGRDVIRWRLERAKQVTQIDT